MQKKSGENPSRLNDTQESLRKRNMRLKKVKNNFCTLLNVERNIYTKKLNL